MAQTLGEIRQQVAAFVVEQRQAVEGMAARLKAARKELRNAERVLRRLGGPPKTAPNDEMTATRGRVLTLLRNNGGMRPHELKDAAGAGTWTLARWREVTDGLLADGLIEVKGQTTGQRVHLRLQS